VLKVRIRVRNSMEDQSELNAWIEYAIPCLYRPAAFLQLPWQKKTSDNRPFGSCVAHRELKTKIGAPA
jgi:hypothetical protein